MTYTFINNKYSDRCFQACVYADKLSTRGTVCVCLHVAVFFYYLMHRSGFLNLISTHTARHIEVQLQLDTERIATLAFALLYPVKHAYHCRERAKKRTCVVTMQLNTYEGISLAGSTSLSRCESAA